MNRPEPPRLATWMLEHLTPADRDEALAGDLLESFRGGRSHAWYWHQALSACAATWLANIRARIPMLVCALLWSMLAPAWTVLVDRITHTRLVRQLSQFDWPLSGLAELAVWIALNSTFLWAGILLYVLANTRFATALHNEKLRRSFRLAPLLFLPFFVATAILMNLYAFPGFDIDRHTITPAGAITDLRIWADALRLPYFLSLAFALWGAIPRRISLPSFADSQAATPTYLDSRLKAARPDPLTVKKFLGFVVCAGLLNALIAAFLLCRLPASHAPDLKSVFIRALIYVTLGALAGAGGAWLYWNNPASPFRENPPLPFPLFALVCAAGWVWVPAMVIFSEQLSPATALIAMIGAFLLATGLRHATFPVFAPPQQAATVIDPAESELFAESLYRAPGELHGYIIAAAVYMAGWELFTRSNYTAAALLALAAFVFGWQRTIPRTSTRGGQVPQVQVFGPGIPPPSARIPVSHSDPQGSDGYKPATLRLAQVALPAVLVTLWALLDGVSHRNRLAALNAGPDANASSAQTAAQTPASSAAPSRAAGGYISVILWPPPEKQQILPPILLHDSILVPGSTRPLIVRFDGPYWYLQPPDQKPGPLAHHARGNPLAENIESNNSIPLVMEAHQTLFTAIPISRCREIQVEIESRDNTPGPVAMAILLSDSAEKDKQSVFLGEQQIPSTVPGRFTVKSAPVIESLPFAVPPAAKLKRFNEITVMLLPDIEHAFAAPKIAIRQFQLFPR